MFAEGERIRKHAAGFGIAVCTPARGVFGFREVPLLTADEMRAMDRRATEEQGIPERVLMENAGRAVARIVAHHFPEGPVVAAVGGGNNGGDALVALRTLRTWGREVCAISAVADPSADELLHEWELPRVPMSDAELPLHTAAIILDGILGTGAHGAPRQPQAQLIERINASGRATVALDGPSGVDFTTGQTPGAVIRAALTITFGAPKRGLLLFPGRECAGQILAVEIGFPPLDPQTVGAAVITPLWAHAHLPPIPANAHKGTTGTVAVVAGSATVAGAPEMVAMGAARAGAGLVRFVSPLANRGILQTRVPEAVFTDRDAADLAAVLEQADAVVVGPGIGTDEAAEALLRLTLESGSAPLLLDADALTLAARNADLLAAPRDRPLLITPHPGEMGRMLGCDTEDVVADPFRRAAEAADRWGCSVLLKGSPSIVAQTGEPTLANVSGHSGIATGGTGDTLAGIAGAFLAQGASPRVAGALALFFSGRAAELAGGGRSLLPRDLAAWLGAAFEESPAAAPPRFPEVMLDLPPPR